jgi:hypothetical protein
MPTMNENKHIHRVQSQWVAFLSLIWNSRRFELSKKALKCLVCREMTTRSKLWFCERMGRREDGFFAGQVESHFRDSESTRKIGEESQSTIEKSNDVHQPDQS